MQSKHTEGFGLKSLEQLPLPLLEWYRDNARTLPWRSDPTPYHVWISEIMLQQTRVAAVLDYYRRFLEELPTVQRWRRWRRTGAEAVAGAGVLQPGPQPAKSRADHRGGLRRALSGHL